MPEKSSRVLGLHARTVFSFQGQFVLGWDDPVCCIWSALGVPWGFHQSFCSFLLTFFAIMTLPFTLHLFPLFFCTRSLSFVLLLNFLIVQFFLYFDTGILFCFNSIIIGQLLSACVGKILMKTLNEKIQ